MARPRKQDSDKASVSIRVPLTVTEREEMRQGADLLGMKVAAMLRDAGLREARKAIRKANVR